MKVKCPNCRHVFESLEHPQPVIGSESEEYGANFSSSEHRLQKLQPHIYGKALKSIGVGLSSVSSNFQSSVGETKSLPTVTMKKGYKEIFDTIDKYHGATWKELENETNLSTRTLSKRLTEGKQAGIIDKVEEREGRKVYIKR